MMRTCSPNEVWVMVHAFWASRQVRAVCTERANCGVLIVIVIERVIHTPHHTRNTAEYT